MMMMIINSSENKDRYIEVVENRTAIPAFDIQSRKLGIVDDCCFYLLL